MDFRVAGFLPKAPPLARAGGVSRRFEACAGQQRTLPGEYYHWHVDAGPGGETEFALQEVTIRPAQGKLLLFTPFRTRVHRDVTLEKASSTLPPPGSVSPEAACCSEFPPS